LSRDSLPPDYCETRKRARAVIGLLEAAFYANPGDLSLIGAASVLADAEANIMSGNLIVRSATSTTTMTPVTATFSWRA
jgi:hypothetical protein